MNLETSLLFLNDLRTDPEFLRLTPAGRASWIELENRALGDFTIASAISGSLYAGLSPRCVRVRAALARTHFPQDILMVLLSLSIQIERVRGNYALEVLAPGTECVMSYHGPGFFCGCPRVSIGRKTGRGEFGLKFEAQEIAVADTHAGAAIRSL